jgi:hypothetical protein
MLFWTVDFLFSSLHSRTSWASTIFSPINQNIFTALEFFQKASYEYKNTTNIFYIIKSEDLFMVKHPKLPENEERLVVNLSISATF